MDDGTPSPPFARAAGEIPGEEQLIQSFVRCWDANVRLTHSRETWHAHAPDSPGDPVHFFILDLFALAKLRKTCFPRSVASVSSAPTPPGLESGRLSVQEDVSIYDNVP
ncbi:Surfeit locus 1 family protein [Anopheles sinensis]|uniref:Surfeit locus 1 family protein n=1 Tax=Anopheles sinensis TaxID=74873 RepID=A0A084VXZ8_ANOSI|nr:Surfeit locus 1 family protein [Anopheles sinensis]